MRPDPDGVRRRRTFLAGLRAERVALIWLACKGYRILDRRYAVRGGEIDLVLRRGETVAFVEVKARPTLEAAMGAVTPGKLHRIDRAAATWLARNPWGHNLTLRGDLLAVAPWRWPHHLEGALPLTVGQ